MILYIAIFILSAAAATGVGGGGVFTLLLTLLNGVPQIRAQGMNLFAFVFAAVPAAAIHIKRGGAEVLTACFLSFCACAGCIAGSMLAASSAEKTLRLVFGIFALTVGAVSLVMQLKKSKEDK